ncbi:uncharacterized protein LOC108441442 [Pygocentrus nattereri]|uniref:uncharacterized protein LOC108441442 n=1 Tax=Pygocentrus nattereri TaxID=42514 RepID=UPI001891C9BF|nr:uncharacterized protein LOC108441442 [Pygocentrus nattereri]XP_037398014.1 uncharacterized protein LOC108441442 [Pygocentrus nattereri]XP_037398015.1 uncharacterized protein LOC108441442 [Pygocentrus nattereri]
MTAALFEDFEGITCQTPFQRHFNNVIKSAPLDLQGPPNVYYSGTFLTTLATHFLPQAALWTSLMLGDLGRHGEGVAYQQFSKRFSKISKKTTQEHRIQTEKWKQRKRNKRGVYVCPIRKPFLLRSKQISMSSTSKSIGSKTPVAADDRMDQDHTKKQPDTVQRNPVTFMTSTPSTSSEPPTSKCVLRKKTNTNERKVSVPVQKSTGMKTGEKENHGPIWGIYSPKGIIPTARLSRPVVIHHDQLINILDPHTWLSSDEMDLACITWHRNTVTLMVSSHVCCFQHFVVEALLGHQ